MSETPSEPLDDPADYQDESEPDTGDLPLIADLLAEEQDFDGVIFEEGVPSPEDADPQLGVSPGGTITTPTPGPLTPVSSWVEVDEGGTFEELVPADVEPVDEPEDDVTTLLEIDEEDENAPEDTGPQWAKYEVWGRDRDEGVEWQLLSTQDYGQDAQAEIEGLRTGIRMEFRVRLLSTDNIASEWSEIFFYTLPSDLTPPPAPTPPTAENNAGFITHSHDGTLTDDVPPDMSHRVLYAQQMHPAGDPDGPAGDPQRIAEWRGTGATTITVGRYVAFTLHRCWLVAVDTTGNESARSEYVYFTPQKPFDAAEFEERLLEMSGGNLEDGFYDNLMARLGEFLTVRTDQLVANDATGNTFTAPLMQSHTDAKGWKHKPDGTSEWRNMATGQRNTEVRSDGTLFSRGAEVDGDITARSLDLQGGLRVGSGEGAITPAPDGRIRLEGRLPAVDGSRDMIIQGASSSFRTNWGIIEWTVTYDSPSPTGTRRVFAGVNLNRSVSDGNVNANVGARTASGFTVVTQPMFTAGGATFWVHYVGFWV